MAAEIFVPLGFFGWMIAIAYMKHQQRLAELSAQSGLLGKNSNAQSQPELTRIGDQLRELRDTTTRYDMSFDAALQRLEQRMSSLEQRVENQEAASRQVASR